MGNDSAGYFAVVTFDEPIEAGFVLHAWGVEDRQRFDEKLHAYVATMDEGSEGGPQSIRGFRLHRKPPGKLSPTLIDVLRGNSKWSHADPSPRLDRVLLLRFSDVAAAQAHLQREESGQTLEALADCCATNHAGAYRNLVRVGEVSESRDASYLFNFFFTDRPDTFLDTWKQTSLWFFPPHGTDLLVRAAGPRPRLALPVH